MTRDVDVATPGGPPRVLAQERLDAGRRRIVAVDGAADPGLAQVVPAGPREVPDHVRMSADRRPTGVNRRGMRLAAHDHAIRIELAVHGKARLHVVVPDHVEIRGGLGRVLGHDRRGHQVVESIGQLCHGSVHARLLVGFRRAALSVLGQLGEELGTADEEPTDGFSDEPRGVERPDFRRQRTADACTHRRPRLRDFVADAVQDHARVIEVLADHGFHIRLPPVGETKGVVVLVLRLRPHVECLVHDEHPEAITGGEHRLAQGVVRAPDRVEPCLLEELDPAFFRAIDRGRTEQAVVVVDAGTSQEDGFPVDAQSAPGVGRQRPDPERRRILVHLHFSLPQAGPARVEVGVVGIPSVWCGDTKALPGGEDIARHRRDRCLR